MQGEFTSLVLIIWGQMLNASVNNPKRVTFLPWLTTYENKPWA
jgi:hypothetical protein